MGIREIIGRLWWMLQVKNCHHVCLFCRFYSICRVDDGKEGGKEE